MKRMEKLKCFDQFVLEERCAQRTSAISTAVSRIKEIFGDTKEKFLKSAKERGVDDIKEFVVQTLKPHLDRIDSQETLQNGGRPTFDYDELLSGLVSWILVQIEVERMKKANKKENKYDA